MRACALCGSSIISTQEVGRPRLYCVACRPQGVTYSPRSPIEGRRCASCSEVIPSGARRDAKFCSRGCKSALSLQRKRSAQPKHPRVALCGTHSGYVMHRRRGEEACAPCKAATAQRAMDRRRASGIGSQRAATNLAACLSCGRMSGRGNFCSIACTAAFAPPNRPCAECGQGFQPKSLATIYCSLDCRRAHNVRLEFGRYGNETRRASSQRRRARLAGATIGEPFTNDEIFERDEWCCGLCGEQVDRRLAHPDPMSKSLDHILPLFHGGAHSRENVQLAHLTCNVRKGAHVDSLAA